MQSFHWVTHMTVTIHFSVGFPLEKKRGPSVALYWPESLCSLATINNTSLSVPRDLIYLPWWLTPVCSDVREKTTQHPKCTTNCMKELKNCHFFRLGKKKKSKRVQCWHVSDLVARFGSFANCFIWQNLAKRVADISNRLVLNVALQLTSQLLVIL